MRLRPLAIALPLWAGCASGSARPYRFASPLLGSADVPAPLLRDPLPGASPRGDFVHLDDGTRIARHVDDDSPIRSASAPTIHVASAAAAAAITEAPAAAEEHRDALPAPNLLSKTAPLPTVRTVTDLRALVGYRDARGPLVATLALAATLHPHDETGLTALAIEKGSELVDAAQLHDRLRDPTSAPEPGDLLVFDHTDSADEADRIAIVIAQDSRGVTEFMYLGGGVWRRGFVDVANPSKKRSATGAVLNTYMRTGNRYPPKGTKYLAGELLAHVVEL